MKKVNFKTIIILPSKEKYYIIDKIENKILKKINRIQYCKIKFHDKIIWQDILNLLTRILGTYEPTLKLNLVCNNKQFNEYSFYNILYRKLLKCDYTIKIYFHS